MSGKKKTAKEQKLVDDTVDDADFGQVEETQSEPDTGEFLVEPLTATTGKKGSAIIGWSALLLSGIAIAAIGVDFYRDRNAAGNIATSGVELRALTASVSATRDALASLEQNIATLSNLDGERNARIDSLGRQFNDRLRQLEALPGRLSTVEASMASVQGISPGVRDAWLLAEAGYFMQIANAQLQLANNPELAHIALAHADERILQLADPAFTSIRQALSDEMRALELLQTPDTAGITLTLASLAAAVESLPLRQESIVIVEPATATETDLTGVDRALATMKQAINDAVRVRRTDETMQPLIAPEAQFFLRANLALQMQVARLALLRGEETVFRQSLADADSWLAKYYDVGNTGVRNARETLAEIRESVLTVATPDISQSLRLLRQFNALNAASGAIAIGEAEQER